MKTLILCVLAAVVLSSCGNLESDQVGGDIPKLEIVKTDFRWEKAAWEALGIDRYSFTFSCSGGSEPISDITVFVYPDKEPVTVNCLGEKVDIAARDVFYTLKSINISDIYTWIEKLLNGYTEEEYKEDVIKLEYDRTYHYPMTYYTFPRYGGVTGYGGFFINEFTDLREQR